MLLNFTDGQPFATGAVAFRIPEDDEHTRRITIPLETEENLTEAIVDTGAPYVVCSPNLASLLELNPDNALEKHRLIIRGVVVTGGLHRINLVLMADEGEGLRLEVTAFVPDKNQGLAEGFLPRSFLGLSHCLEAIRFAVDPLAETFYFG